MLRKCKITVLKKTFNADLAEEYGADGIAPCDFVREGQEYVTDCKKPEGFCDDAWSAMHQYVFAIAHGGADRLFYNNDWIRKPGTAVCSCNDGLRPVIFKIEAVE